MASAVYSSAAPAAVHSFVLKRNIQFSDLGLEMDASIPVAAQKAPAVMVVHGGGWVRGDRRTDVAPLFDPLREAGFAWFSIDYRLVQNVAQFGLGIDDVEAAVNYVRSHAAEFNIDPDRLALVGESAGGQLAAMAALRLPRGAVKAVVAFYTPTDLVELLKNSNYIPGQIRSSVQGTPWESMILAGLSQLSPIQNVRADMPPFLFIHGTEDSLVPFEQSSAMCKRMRGAGASCEVYPVEGAGHGIRWWDESRSDSAWKQKMTDWLQTQLNGQETIRP